MIVAAMFVLYEYKKLQLSNRRKVEKKRQQIREEIDLEKQVLSRNVSFKTRVDIDQTAMRLNTDLDVGSTKPNRKIKNHLIRLFNQL